MCIIIDGIIIFSDSEAQYYTPEIIQRIADDYINRRGIFEEDSEYMKGVMGKA